MDINSILKIEGKAHPGFTVNPHDTIMENMPF